MCDQLAFVKSSVMDVRNLGAAQRGENAGGVTLASLGKSSSNGFRPS
jgi:hypothetical protein